jgi:hypothetical protein
LIAVASACGGSGSSTGPTSGAPLSFTAAPIEPSTIQQIVPLGNLNPPDHTLPTDHIYINNRALGGPPVAPQPVVAPGDGTVQFILRNGADAKAGVQTGAFIYYHDRADAGRADRLRAQAVTGSGLLDASFTDAARIYVR